MSESIEASPNVNSLVGVAQLLNGRMPRAAKLFTYAALAQSAFAVASKAHSHVRARRSYSVAISGEDPIYYLLHEWLLESIGEKGKKSLQVRSNRGRRRVSSGDEVCETVPDDGRRYTQEAPPSLDMFYDGSTSIQVNIDGHVVKVYIDKPDGGNSQAERDPAVRKWLAGAERIVFQAQGVDARDTVLTLLEKMTTDHYAEHSDPRFLVGQSYGQWGTRTGLPVRPFDSVVLKDGQKERLIKDVGDFFSLEEAYLSLGTPFHRGYLFQGPPGTGKTSIARGLASYFNLDVFYLPLADVENDGRLVDMVGSISPHSMLLIEDVDVFRAARDGGSGTEGVTLSGLLNVLDGIASPHGVIVVMTTNHPELVDERLMREGRVDVVLDVGFLDVQQLNALVERALGFNPAFTDVPDGLVPARAVGVLKEHLGNPEGALEALRELLGVNH